MRIQGTSSFPGSETHSIIHGAQARRKPPEAILSRAAEVFISRRGAQLQKGDTDMDALLTPAELALAADQKEIDDKREKKSQAADIEARIRTDVTLSDKDKSVLQKQVDMLKKEGMTDEDRLAQLYRERGVWEKRSMSDTAAPDEKNAAGSRSYTTTAGSIILGARCRKKKRTRCTCAPKRYRSVPISKPPRKRNRRRSTTL